MINLLPLSEKINLKKEKRVKIVLISMLIFLYFLVCSILILISIKFYTQGEIELEKNLLRECQSRYQCSEIQNIEDDIKITNKNIGLINSFYDNKNVCVDSLKKISEIIPNGICLTNVAFNSYSNISRSSKEKEKNKEEYSFQASIMGIADSRKDLFNFKEILEEQDDFTQLYISPSNWTKPLDVNFNLTFAIF